MPSHSLQRWSNQGRTALDQIERAHAAVGGHAPGRRYATLQINHAYLVLVASHFQRYCKDLHAESTDYLCAQDPPPGRPDPRRDVLRFTLTLNLQLDRQNAQPGSIGADFNRFNLNFWDQVKAVAPVQNERRRGHLVTLNTWRNAIAHQDFPSAGLDPASVTLPFVRRLRTSCDHLAQRFDEVMAAHLATMTGARPW